MAAPDTGASHIDGVVGQAEASPFSHPETGPAGGPNLGLLGSATTGHPDYGEVNRRAHTLETMASAPRHHLVLP